MPCYHLTWADARRTALYLKMTPGWDWADLFPAAVETAERLDEVEHRVDLLIEMPGQHPTPASALPMFDAIAAMPAFTHPNAGRTVVVATDAHINRLLTLFRFTYPGLGEDVLLVETPQAARAMLQMFRTTGLSDFAPMPPALPPYVP